MLKTPHRDGRLTPAGASAVLALATLAACQESGDGDQNDALCAELDNESPGPAQTIQIENARDQDVFLLNAIPCGDSTIGATRPMVRVETFFPDPTGRSYPAPAFGTWPSTDCFITCQDLRDGNEVECQGDCEGLPLIRLAPGGIYEEVWPGTLRTPAWLPKSCIPARAPEGSLRPDEGPCEVEVAAPEGQYVVRAHEVLFDPSYAAQYPCEPNAAGWCNSSASRDWATGYAHTYTVFDYPATTVRLRFE